MGPQFRLLHDIYNGHFTLLSIRFPGQNVAVLHLACSRNNGQRICIYFIITLYKNTQISSMQLLTYSMVQSPSWAADWLAASQEIPRISRNPKVHYRTHKRPPPVKFDAVCTLNRV